jgi:hypothetical protein
VIGKAENQFEAQERVKRTATASICAKARRKPGSSLIMRRFPMARLRDTAIMWKRLAR